MSRPEEDGGFLGRWARRKQEAQRAEAYPEPRIETPAMPEPATDTAEPLPLPSLDDVVPGGDVSRFFQAHVPEALRKAALRKLWTTDPEISGFIEMADYQWDFNNPDSIPGWSSSLKTEDATRLLGRMFGVGEAKDDAASGMPDVREAGATDQPDEIDAETRSGAEPAIAKLEPEPAPAIAVQPEGDVAPQNKQDESVVYVRSRKRHGGALPT